MSRVFDRARAYLRGYLEGGYVEAFFRNDVPAAGARGGRDLSRALPLRSGPGPRGRGSSGARRDRCADRAGPAARSLARGRRCPHVRCGSRRRSGARDRRESSMMSDRTDSLFDDMAKRRSIIPNRLTLGIDEAGRGPSVGPMVMAAVAIDYEGRGRADAQGPARLEGVRRRRGCARAAQRARRRGPRTRALRPDVSRSRSPRSISASAAASSTSSSASTRVEARSIRRPPATRSSPTASACSPRSASSTRSSSRWTVPRTRTRRSRQPRSSRR